MLVLVPSKRQAYIGVYQYRTLPLKACVNDATELGEQFRAMQFDRQSYLQVAVDFQVNDDAC